jgi:hypothetical protein
MNKMNFIENVLAKKLKEAEPTIDIFGADRKVLDVASQDFANYLKFNWNLLGTEPTSLDYEQKIEMLHKEEQAEIESYLTVWTGIWLKKWRQRVNLLIGKQNQKKSGKASVNFGDADIRWAKLECREEIIGMVVSALIRNAEICGTQIIAENLLKKELGKKVDLDVKNKEQVLSLLNSTLHTARDFAQRIGPFISIKVDKSYYCMLSN